MLLISQNARLLDIPFCKETVFRLNTAWVQTKEDLFYLLENIKGDVFLDFPKGRTKPPKPVLRIGDLQEAISTFDKIKYFALSNVESGLDVDEMRRLVSTVKLVPKIESRAGIEHIFSIINALKDDEKYLMLDKEDLYVDLKCHDGKFVKYIDILRSMCRERGKELLQLQGVIFTS